MPTNKLTPEIITAAIEGFESQKRRIDDQIAELRALLLGRGTEPAATPESVKTKRKISAAARRRMALGQQKRWAAIKGTTESPSQVATPEPSKPKRKLSVAGRAAIVAALKRRWKEKKAAAAKIAPAAPKKSAAEGAPAAEGPRKPAPKQTHKTPLS